jgi:hypothetical protein
MKYNYLKTTETGLELILSETEMPKLEHFSKLMDATYLNSGSFEDAYNNWYASAKRVPVDKGSVEGFIKLSQGTKDMYAPWVYSEWLTALKQGILIQNDCYEIITPFGFDESEARAFFKSPPTEQKEPCSNCKETENDCACIRNKCNDCGEPVGNITFTVCDKCWDKAEQKEESNEAVLFKEAVEWIVSNGWKKNWRNDKKEYQWQQFDLHSNPKRDYKTTNELHEIFKQRNK